jgi:hypothetical protein
MNSIKTFSKSVLVSVVCSDCNTNHPVDIDTTQPCTCGAGMVEGTLNYKDISDRYTPEYNATIRFEKSVNKGSLFDL